MTARSLGFCLLWLAACKDHEVACTVVADPAQPLVTHVTWDAGVAGASTLDFSWAEGSGAGRMTQVGTANDAAIVGVPPLEDVAFEAVTRAGKQTWTCEGSTRTGNLPTETPTFLVTVDVPERRSPEGFLVGSLITGTDSPMFVVDREGRFRWIAGAAPDRLVVMAAPALDGGLIDVSFARLWALRDGALHRRDLVSDDTEPEPVPRIHHVFRELPDRSLLYLKLDVRDAMVGGVVQPVAGDSVVQRTPDGEDRVLFSTWDHLAIRDEIEDFQAFYPEGLDWVHGNALFYVESRDTVLYSMANVRTVVEFDRETGAVVRSFRGGDDWTLDGDDYTVASGERFRLQHDAHYDAAGNLVVFATNDVTANTGAHVYAIDDVNHTLSEVWSHVPDPPLRNWAIGQVQELSNGDRLIAFPVVGVLQEVTPDGEVVWEVHTPINVAFGQVYLRDDLP